jgi:hypothetical protein
LTKIWRFFYSNYIKPVFANIWSQHWLMTKMPSFAKIAKIAENCNHNNDLK